MSLGGSLELVTILGNVDPVGPKTVMSLDGTVEVDAILELAFRDAVVPSSCGSPTTWP